MNLETLDGRELVALILFAGCLMALLAIHVQVELTAIRREIRRLRRQVRRGPTNPAKSAAMRAEVKARIRTILRQTTRGTGGSKERAKRATFEELATSPIDQALDNGTSDCTLRHYFWAPFFCSKSSPCSPATYCLGTGGAPRFGAHAFFSFK